MEKRMSVSQFPNATWSKVEEVVDLFDQLIPNPDPVLEPDLELAVAAFMCAAAEHVINMQKLALYHTLDPTIVSKIKSTLASCK